MRVQCLTSNLNVADAPDDCKQKPISLCSSLPCSELHSVQQLGHGVPRSVGGRFGAGFCGDRHRPGWDRLLHGQRERPGGGERDVQLLPRPCVWTAESLWNAGAQTHVATNSQGQKGYFLENNGLCVSVHLCFIGALICCFYLANGIGWYFSSELCRTLVLQCCEAAKQKWLKCPAIRQHRLWEWGYWHLHRTCHVCLVLNGLDSKLLWFLIVLQCHQG